MSCSVSVRPMENGTAKVTAIFHDEDGAPTIPTSVKWTLMNSRDAIVNGREDVDVAPLAAEMSWLLFGDDLPRDTLTIQINALYDSTLGSDLPLRAEVSFSTTKMTTPRH